MILPYSCCCITAQAALVTAYTPFMWTCAAELARNYSELVQGPTLTIIFQSDSCILLNDVSRNIPALHTRQVEPRSELRDSLVNDDVYTSEGI